MVRLSRYLLRRPTLQRTPVLSRCVLVALISIMSGAAEASPIVMEAWIGERPTTAETSIGPVIAELAARGYRPGPEGIGARYEAEQSRPGVAVSASRLTALREIAERGCTAWFEGRFRDAAPDLEEAVEIATSAPAAIAENQIRREVFRRAMVCLALAYQRLGQPKEAERMAAEALRTFRGILPVTDYGPEAQTFFGRVAATLASHAKASIEVVVGDPEATVYLDEAVAGVGDVRVTALIPGTYRLLVRKGRAPGRVYLVELAPGKKTSVQIDWRCDGVIRTAPKWVGFAFPDEHSRKELLAPCATRFARLVGAESVAVVGVVANSPPAVTGVLYGVKPEREIRSRSIPLTAKTDPAALRGLAAFLAGEPGAGGPAAPGSVIRRPEGSSPLWPMVLVETGIALTTTGAALIALDNKCDGSACDAVVRWEAGAGVAAAGVAAIGTGVYLHLRRSKKPPRMTITPVMHGGVGLTVGGRF